MPDNREVSEFLAAYGVYLTLKGENSFRTRAYATAARTFEFVEEDVAELVKRGALTDLRGVGDSMARLIEEFVGTGTAAAFEELKSSVPPGLWEMLRVQGLGPSKVRAVYDQLGIESLEALEAAGRDGRLVALKGFGAKTVDKILQSIAFLRQNQGLFRLNHAQAAAAELVQTLSALPHTRCLDVAGPLRRHCELVPGVDLVLVSDDAAAARAAFTSAEEVAEVLSEDEDPIRVRLHNGIQAALYLADADTYAARLHHLTGDEAYLEALQVRAAAQGCQLSGTGLQRDGAPLALDDEAALFAALGLPSIPPELREGPTALTEDIPQLVCPEDVRGMLHVHSTYSDGRDSLEAMAAAVRQAGYAYLGICDHSRSAAYAGGLKEADIRRQHEEIDRLNAQWDDFRIFKGIESDILPDGSLDYDDAVLDSFDLVVASVHSAFNMDEAAMTARLIRAIEHPACTLIGHLTGRLLLERDGYAVDHDAVIAAAARCGVAIEINANPYRLDMDWRHVKKARDAGVQLAVNTDAHKIADLDYIDIGVGIARKGWLRAADVINCLDTDAFAAYLGGAKERT